MLTNRFPSDSPDALVLLISCLSLFAGDVDVESFSLLVGGRRRSEEEKKLKSSRRPPNEDLISLEEPLSRRCAGESRGDAKLGVNL